MRRYVRTRGVSGRSIRKSLTTARIGKEEHGRCSGNDWHSPKHRVFDCRQPMANGKMQTKVTNGRDGLLSTLWFCACEVCSGVSYWNCFPSHRFHFTQPIHRHTPFISRTFFPPLFTSSLPSIILTSPCEYHRHLNTTTVLPLCLAISCNCNGFVH